MKAITKTIKKTSNIDLMKYHIDVCYWYKDLCYKYGKGDAYEASVKHFRRIMDKYRDAREQRTKTQQYKQLVELFDKLVYNPTATSSRYNCTGIDWRKYHRGSSNGIGWVAICPDEPGNNIYTDNPYFVKRQKRLFGQRAV